MTVEVREHALGADLDAFLAAGREVFRGDSAYISPLDKEIRERLTPGINPFFEHGEAAVFTAARDGRVVGRCTASIDREHLRIHQDDAGFFGFFDTIDDEEVARALLAAAEAWLRARGIKRMRGPMSLCINEECGLLVEGFEHPPVLMTGHSRPYQAALAEKAGLVRTKDLLAWRYEVGDVPPRAQRAWESVGAMPEVKFRSFRRSKLREDLGAMTEIFNDAWSHNWGFVPATPAEMEKAANDIAMILDEEIAFFADIDGRPMGICVALPNLNEAISDLDGRLFPFGVFKLLWRTKVSGLRSARLITLGIRRELRGSKRYGALSTAMYAELARRGRARGYQWAELSWTLEDNAPVNLGIRAMGGQAYKRYRIYERSIA